MTIENKKNLFSLLNAYMIDLIKEDNENNEKRTKRMANRMSGAKEYDPELETTSGVKAQFNHARCIAKKLGVEIEKEMVTL